MDRAGSERFFGADDDLAGSGRQSASPVLSWIVERLADCPAVVFSRFGEVLLQTRPAMALLGDGSGFGGPSGYGNDGWFTDPGARAGPLVEVGPTPHRHLRRYRHARLGEVELYRQLLVDPVDHQLLLVLIAVPGSLTEAKLRRLTVPDDRP